MLVLIGQVCHKIRSSGVKYKNQSKILRSEKLDQDCDSCLKTVDFKNDIRTKLDEVLNVKHMYNKCIDLLKNIVSVLIHPNRNN